MQISCSICKDLLIPHSEAVVTKCGHLYHEACISQWFKDHNTCPKCRAKLKKETLQRVYFDVENDTDIDPSTLQYKIDKLTYNIEVQNGEKKELNKKITEMESQMAALRVMLSESEEKEQAARDTSTYLKTQLRRALDEAGDIKRVKEECQNLKHKLAMLERVERMIKGTEEEVNKMLDNTPVTPRSVQQLCTFIVVLKQQIEKHVSRKEMLLNDNKELAKDLNDIKKKNLALSDQVKDLKIAKDKLEEEIIEQKKLLEIERNKTDSCTSTAPLPKRAKGDSNDLCNFESQRASFWDHSLDLSPPIIEYNLVTPEGQKAGKKRPVFNLNTKIVNNLDLNKPKSAAENTPDFIDLDIAPGPSRKKPLTISNTGIFKKPLNNGKMMNAGSNASRSNFTYDGMGGSKKISLATPTPPDELASIFAKKKGGVTKKSVLPPAAGMQTLNHFLKKS